MQVEISKWNRHGDELLRVYDPEIADMEEVNRYVHSLEHEMSARAFDSGTSEVIDKVTKETSGIIMVPQMAGG